MRRAEWPTCTHESGAPVRAHVPREVCVAFISRGRDLEKKISTVGPRPDCEQVDSAPCATADLRTRFLFRAPVFLPLLLGNSECLLRPGKTSVPIPPPPSYPAESRSQFSLSFFSWRSLLVGKNAVRIPLRDSRLTTQSSDSFPQLP